MLLDLNDKTIVVTGCSSGIGAATAQNLLRCGASVIGVDRNESDNVDTFYQCDLSDPLAIDELVARLPGEIDGLANIAGVPPTMSAEVVLKVNLLGLQRLTLGLIGKMADNASIVNLGSLAAFRWMKSVDVIKASYDLTFDNVQAFISEHGIDQQTGRSYFFSKEALVAWTFKNRWTWRDRGIRMNAVSPGAVDTPILADFLSSLGARADEDRKTMDRPATPEDIAPVVAFLMTDNAAWFQGANLTLDGGMSSHMLAGMFNL
ncbi:coniferyl-alcohol dehydrogenase [Kordiimonas aquimaris]|uniref:coniferyl-alcohol dehydrogenase n=1 Tax=Kordiimonas aquimaris TaxID=707591 RepID=UPI0021D27FD2|nr:coniferyl-alcohol dehydrogenase [Kordiimonas aquimaris]